MSRLHSYWDISFRTNVALRYFFNNKHRFIILFIAFKAAWQRNIDWHHCAEILFYFFPNESGAVQLILPCLQLNYTALSPLTSLELAKRKVGTLKCCPPLRPQEWDTNCHQPRSPSTTPTASCMHWASACPPRTRTIWGEDRQRSTGQMGLNSQLVWNLVRNERRISGVWSALKQIRS